ncbi:MULTISPECIES: hypothetical protein [unclassified Streptomyces]|uniref:hypothetical protein n=1 Tax=unclassified Streptomyces TaxID=2593676 RepID=UPI0035D92E86
MEEDPGDTESHKRSTSHPIFSGRELSALSLELARAHNEKEKARIIEEWETTREDPKELYEFDDNLLPGTDEHD